MLIRRSQRRQRNRLHKRYYQYTGCPSCGWRPSATHVPEPELLRLGVTQGNTGGRILGYQREGREYFDHVGVIGVVHMPPGTTRQQNLDLEADEIRRFAPPFNVQHHPDPDSAEMRVLRARILGEPVAWFDVAAARIERAADAGVQLLVWLLLIAVGFAGAAVLMTVR